MKLRNENISLVQLLRWKMADYSALTKFRLSALVVVSSLFGYWMAADSIPSLMSALFLLLGGFLVTASANALNQVFEKDFDRQMKRTENRPLPTGRMNSVEASIAAGIMGLSGIIILSVYFNMLTGMLSALSLISYAFVYTPMKRISPIATFIGAIPGALPPLIGYVAFSNEVNLIAAIIFMIQFIWQFPHFWAIAWVAFDDYKKAGYMLLPSRDGKTRLTAFLSLLYALALIPVSIMPYYYGFVGVGGSLACVIFSLVFSYYGFVFYRRCDDASARKLMFASFFYLPLVQLALILAKP